MAVFDLRPRQPDLWRTRLYYFFLGGSGFIAPFLNLFYVRIGLSGGDIGLTAAVGAVIALIAAPVWTSQSSQRRHPRLLLQTSLVLSGLSLLWLGQQRLFWGIVLVVAVSALVSAGLSPLSDAAALSVTGASRSGFGSVRVWASMGWIVAVLLSGWLIERAGFGPAFGGAALASFLGALLLFSIGPRHFSSARTSSQTSLPLGALLRGLWQNRAMVGAGLMMIIIGIGNSGVGQFETVYLSTLGAKESLIGIAGMVSAVVEIPCMLWADRLVRRQGAHRLLLISMAMTALLRGMVLAFPSVLTIMVERAVGGLPFSLYVVGLMAFISEQTAPQETGTVLAFYTVTLVNLIGIVSSPVAGAAYDGFGARWLYAVAAVGYGLGWLSLRLTKRN